MNPKEIKILYYAILRDQSNRRDETLQTTAGTAEELYNELKKRYSFSLSKDLVRPAVNNAFCDWDTELKSGDEVIFIPPVAGG